MNKSVMALIGAFLAVLIALPLDTAFAGRGGGHGGGGRGGHVGGHHGGGHISGHRGGGHIGRGHVSRGSSHRGYSGHYNWHGNKYSYKNHGKYYRYGRYSSWGYWPGIYVGTGYSSRRCYSPVYGWVPCRYRYYGYSY